MALVKMKKAGRWADPQPHIPQIEVEAGEEVEVSIALAEVMVNAGAAERVTRKEPTGKGGKKNPAQVDKDAADKGKADA